MKKAYPEIKTYRMPPRTLKPLKEAFRDEDAEKKEFEFYHDLTNDEDWELAVSAYKDTELPASRFDQEAMYDESAGYMRYNWEIEQDLTDDFVSQVRDGQVQAANDLGIEEFVWGAIIDNKTCEECCLPRNGKTTSEIEKMGGGDCDGTVPPLHPNCRCDIAPVASTDEVDGPDWKSFEEWLAA
jgi:SPP1 gp7 family putative phage head morphogenesis protein